jgi:hypothetical protein
MARESVQFGTVETRVPVRLDRLPWSRFHWLVVIGLGTVDPRRPRGHESSARSARGSRNRRAGSG